MGNDTTVASCENTETPAIINIVTRQNSVENVCLLFRSFRIFIKFQPQIVVFDAIHHVVRGDGKFQNICACF